jgi:hypothetical protein
VFSGKSERDCAAGEAQIEKLHAKIGQFVNPPVLVPGISRVFQFMV